MARNHGAHGREGLGSAPRLPGGCTGSRRVPKATSRKLHGRAEGSAPCVLEKKCGASGGGTHVEPPPHLEDILRVDPLAHCSLPAPSLQAVITSAASTASYGESHTQRSTSTTYPHTFEEDEHHKGKAPNFTN